MSNNENLADVRRPIRSLASGPAPFVIRVIVQEPFYAQGGGLPAMKSEDYVLFSMLPDDLKEKVRTAIQMKLSGY